MAFGFVFPKHSGAFNMRTQQGTILSTTDHIRSTVLNFRAICTRFEV